MKIVTNENGIRVLTPAEGMYLFDGATYSQLVYLGKNASADDWVEVSKKPELEEAEEELTETEEKAKAYDILMGVRE